MKTLETERLILRKFKEEDFEAVHSYGGCAENLTYMLFGPNSEEQTMDVIKRFIRQAEENPIVNYDYAVVLKESVKLIGSCGITLSDDKGEVGWLIHRDYWNKGYGTELAKELLRFGFKDLKLRRIVASCDAENIGSYKIMEKLGMRKEAHFLEARPAHKKSNKKYSDELRYGILKREWENQA